MYIKSSDTKSNSQLIFVKGKVLLIVVLQVYVRTIHIHSLSTSAQQPVGAVFCPHHDVHVFLDFKEIKKKTQIQILVSTLFKPDT